MIVAMVEQESVFEVELYRMYFDDDPADPVSWSAEWALQGSSSATEDCSEQLDELITAVVDDIRQFAQRRGQAVRIDWSLAGDAPQGATVAEAVAVEDVALPERVLPA